MKKKWTRGEVFFEESVSGKWNDPNLIISVNDIEPYISFDNLDLLNEDNRPIEIIATKEEKHWQNKLIIRFADDKDIKDQYFIAIHQDIDNESYTTIGIFTSKEKANTACKEDAGETLDWERFKVRNYYKVYPIELDEIWIVEEMGE